MHYNEHRADARGLEGILPVDEEKVNMRGEAGDGAS
jgi:hypothetical protein